MLCSLVTRQFNFSELCLYTMPGPGLAFLMSVYSYMQRGYVAVSINPSPGCETQTSVAIRMQETCRDETMPRGPMDIFGVM